MTRWDVMHKSSFGARVWPDCSLDLLPADDHRLQEAAPEPVLDRGHRHRRRAYRVQLATRPSVVDARHLHFLKAHLGFKGATTSL